MRGHKYNEEKRGGGTDEIPQVRGKESIIRVHPKKKADDPGGIL